MTQPVCSVQLHLWNSCVGEITGQCAWITWISSFWFQSGNLEKPTGIVGVSGKSAPVENHLWKFNDWWVCCSLAGGELNPWIPTRRLIPLLATVPHTLPGPSSASPVLCVADIRDELVNESTRPQIWVNSHPGNGLHLARPPVLCVALIFHSGTWVGR